MKDGFLINIKIHAVCLKGSTLIKRLVNHLKFGHYLDKNDFIKIIKKPHDPWWLNVYEMQVTNVRYHPFQAKVNTA